MINIKSTINLLKMDNVPSIVVVSCSSTKPKSLIKLITKTNAIEDTDKNLITQPWLIDTKYYTAEVQIVGLEKDYIRTEKFNENVEALIIHMDSNKPSGLDDIIQWESLEKDCNLEVKLLVSNYCTDDTKVTRNKATEWCLKRGFEFVELYPTINNQEQEEEIIKEKFGVDRIIEALHTHTWSNLIMKNKNSNRDCSIKLSSKAEQSSNNIGLNVDNFLASDAADDFTELFSQLHMMKESLQSMPMSQRTQCAEQMVTAFWKAIGGEEEELLDL